MFKQIFTAQILFFIFFSHFLECIVLFVKIDCLKLMTWVTITEVQKVLFRIFMVFGNVATLLQIDVHLLLKLQQEKKCYESMDFICKRISHHFNARNLYIPCHFKCRIFIRKLTLIHVSIVFMSEKFMLMQCTCTSYMVVTGLYSFDGFYAENKYIQKPGY